MAEMLRRSLLWRLIQAVLRFASGLGETSRALGFLSRTVRASRVHGFIRARLLAPAGLTETSRLAARAEARARRLSRKTRLTACVRASLLFRIYAWLMRCGRESRLLSWLFSGGMTALILFAVTMYLPLDYLLRDVLSVPVLSSCWDEALLLWAFVWLFYQKLDRAAPKPLGLNPQDFPVALFLVTGFCLMCFVDPFPSIQLSGYRAAAQYLLWFYAVTRLVRSERDILRMYLCFVCLAAVLALHGVYQYIVKAPIPASWMTHTETAVRTRVYSIFGSPNIMGDFMALFAPMAAALAYYTKKPVLQALSWLAAIVMCVACLFTMSRAAWAAMAVSIVIFILLVDRRLLLPLLLAGVCACFLPFVRTRIGFLFTKEFAEANTSGGRAGRRIEAMRLFETADKRFGLGHGMFGGAVAMQNQVLDGVEYFYLDNYYLKTMLEMGCTGLAAFGLMLLGLLYNGLRSVSRLYAAHREKAGRFYPLLCAMFAGLCGVLVHCAVENIFEEPYMTAYFWTLAAMIIWLGFLRKPEEAPV